ncbi:hypothetical protein KUDE01_022678 [Dissostichus eleginoides]|uniref:Uncharacterized protein n=1 Tax=Dissostichus eleginoides TaxID=100907 RepID=A0AAD9EWT0_DISEL|nr:hypothetical protein KUDE01_022678 [Dissostichus eleginoides]
MEKATHQPRVGLDATDGNLWFPPCKRPVTRLTHELTIKRGGGGRGGGVQGGSMGDCSEDEGGSRGGKKVEEDKGWRSERQSGWFGGWGSTLMVDCEVNNTMLTRYWCCKWTSRPAHRAEPSEASQDLEVHVPEPLSGGPYFSKLMTR